MNDIIPVKLLTCFTACASATQPPLSSTFHILCSMSIYICIFLHSIISLHVYYEAQEINSQACRMCCLNRRQKSLMPCRSLRLQRLLTRDLRPRSRHAHLPGLPPRHLLRLPRGHLLCKPDACFRVKRPKWLCSVSNAFCHKSQYRLEHR